MIKAYLAGPFISYNKKQFERDLYSWEKLSEHLNTDTTEFLEDYKDWRDLIEKIGEKYLYSFEFLDPRKTGGVSIGGKEGFFEKDLEYIDRSDVVIAYRPFRIEEINGKKISKKIEIEGTSGEMLYAYARKRIIFYVDENPTPHEFLVGAALMLFQTLPALLLYLYLCQEKGGFPAVEEIHEIF